MSLSQRDLQLVQYILKHCDEIADVISMCNEKKNFLANHIYKNATAMALQTISENSRSLSDEFTAGNPLIPWKEIKGIRNIFAHAYDTRIDFEIIWDSINEEIPVIADMCRNILKDNGIEPLKIDKAD